MKYQSPPPTGPNGATPPGHRGSAATRPVWSGPAPEAADGERLDPPDGLWDRIRAAVTDDDRGAGSGLAAGDVVEYSIDASDVVVEVDDAWRQFASDNDAPELAERTPTRTLWDQFADEETRDLWRALVSQVRSTGVEARVPFRCDGPDSRRWFEMTVTSEDAGRVRFRSALVFEDARPGIEMLARETVRDDSAPSVEICDWCARGDDGSRWLTVDQLVLENRLLEETPVPPLRHGICGDCSEAMAAEVERVRANGAPA